ncbi:MAG TPA: hypothetical protein VH765_15770, partial [Xanthobacteraceae bacterium]
ILQAGEPQLHHLRLRSPDERVSTQRSLVVLHAGEHQRRHLRRVTAPAAGPIAAAVATASVAAPDAATVRQYLSAASRRAVLFKLLRHHLVHATAHDRRVSQQHDLLFRGAEEIRRLPRAAAASRGRDLSPVFP